VDSFAVPLHLGAAALAGLLQKSLLGQAVGGVPLHLPKPHFAPNAKNVIYLHMIGAPSQLDLFESKPTLVRRHGETCPAELLAGKKFAFIGGQPTFAGSRYAFARHGQSGHEFSELLPHLAGVSDELTFIRSLHTEEINHAPAQLFLHTGFGRGGRPSFGSWVTYGLGTENQDPP